MMRQRGVDLFPLASHKNRGFTSRIAMGQRARTFVALAAALFSISACSTTSYVLTCQNNFDYRMARFRETCGTPATCSSAPPGCPSTCENLNQEAKALHEAASASKADGK